MEPEERKTEHFQGVLNQPPSDETVVIPEATEDIDIQKAEVHHCLHKKDRIHPL